MKRNIDLYIDHINLITFLIIFFKYDRKKIHRIFYVTCFLPKFTEFFLRGIKIISIDKFPFARIKFENSFFYWHLWSSIEKFLDHIFVNEDISKKFKSFLNTNNFDSLKLTYHLREISIPHVYTPLKFLIFARKFSKQKNTHYILSKSPLNFLIENFFETKFTIYNNFLSYNVFKKKRKDDPHYSNLNFDYASPRIFLFKRLFFLIYACIRAVLQKKPKNSEKKLCIELHQREINLNDVTDLYWSKFSKIKKENMMTISYTKWDKQSLKNLEKVRIDDFYKYDLRICLKDFIKIISLVPKLFFYLYKIHSFNHWLNFHKTFFLAQVMYFKSIYKSYNIKILFHMLDWDPNKFTKTQALELNDGLTMTSHWSNFPSLEIFYRKYSDILFVWSPYFIEKIFNYFSFKKTYSVGYPSDHYFKALNLKKKTDKNFIIGYMDNVHNVDLPYHSIHNKKIYTMLIELTKKYSNLLIYTKPKVKYLFQKSVKNSPKMQKCINEGILTPFFGSKFNEKMSPAEFSNKCDLVISLGISSAGAEASFFGVKSLHYDNMELENKNEFAFKGKNKIVFNKIELLKAAIEKEINLKDFNVEENKFYHGILDNYQDGKCGERTALIIDTIFENFDTLSDLDKSLEKVEKKQKENHNLFKKNY